MSSSEEHPLETSPPLFTIKHATTSSDIAAVKALFAAYTASLNLDLSFQNYDSELASLPGAYSSPYGCLLLAYSSTTLLLPEGVQGHESQVLGCVALRPLSSPLTSTAETGTGTETDSNSTSNSNSNSDSDSSSKSVVVVAVAEMKRLYVSPLGRGTGVGKALVSRVLTEAKNMGYACVKLDTLESMTAAIKLYKSFGFRECAVYYDTPLEERTVFLEKEL